VLLADETIAASQYNRELDQYFDAASSYQSVIYSSHLVTK